jgi:hypothetical protein
MLQMKAGASRLFFAVALLIISSLRKAAAVDTPPPHCASPSARNAFGGFLTLNQR